MLLKSATALLVATKNNFLTCINLHVKTFGEYREHTEIY